MARSRLQETRAPADGFGVELVMASATLVGWGDMTLAKAAGAVGPSTPGTTITS